MNSHTNDPYVNYVKAQDPDKQDRDFYAKRRVRHGKTARDKGKAPKNPVNVAPVKKGKGK